MKIKIKKFNENATTPTYGSEKAAAFDIYSGEQVTILPGETIAVETHLGFDLPEGYYLQLYPRSGLSYTSKIRIANSCPVIDEDYKGSIKIILDNIMTKFPNPYIINKGQRIAQGIVRKVDQVEFEEVIELSETERGTNGFGSSGL